MKYKLLDISLEKFPKDGFHESNILVFKSIKDKLIMRILTSPFYNSFLEDKLMSGFLQNTNEDSLVLELVIDNPKYSFTNYYSFYDYFNADMELTEIKSKGKVIGYFLFSFGYPDDNLDIDKNNKIINKDEYYWYPLQAKIFGSSFKWRIVGLVTNNKRDDNFLVELRDFYDIKLEEKKNESTNTI